MDELILAKKQQIENAGLAGFDRFAQSLGVVPVGDGNETASESLTVPSGQPYIQRYIQKSNPFVGSGSKVSVPTVAPSKSTLPQPAAPSSLTQTSRTAVAPPPPPPPPMPGSGEKITTPLVPEQQQQPLSNQRDDFNDDDDENYQVELVPNGKGGFMAKKKPIVPRPTTPPNNPTTIPVKKNHNIPNSQSDDDSQNQQNGNPQSSTNETTRDTGMKCHGCKAPVSNYETRLMIDGKFYHETCFCCHTCNKQFGTSEPCVMHTPKNDANTINNTNVDDEQYPYCRDCHLQLFASKCHGCQEYIEEGQILTACGGKTFHPHHFTCCVCDMQLASNLNFKSKISFYEDEGNPYCRSCYIQTFSNQ